MIDQLKMEGLFLSNGNFNSSYIRKFNRTLTPERKIWYDSLLGSSLSEKIYNLINNITEFPKCLVCFSPVRFISYKEGYRTYCSGKCRQKGETETIQKTNLKKYGSKAPAGNREIQEKIKKTTFEKYGIKNIFQDKEKIQKSIKDKYGVGNVMQVESVKERLKKTNLAKYGVEYSAAAKDIIEKRGVTNKEKYGNICSLQGKEQQTIIREEKRKVFWNTLLNSNRLKEVAIPLFTIEEYRNTVDEKGQTINYPWKCTKCGNSFEDYIANGKIPRCPFCYPPLIQGIMEKDLADWIKYEFPTIKIIKNTRKIISPMELDIYLPDYNLAIEFDEIYWHCENSTGGKRDSSYHIGKTKRCEEKGITLIHIWDNEWYEKKEVVKSIIKSKLGLLTKIGARQCVLKGVSSEDSKIFLNENHIQGYAPASIRYGLYYKDELVCFIAIAKNRFKINTYEIVRFVNKIGIQVMGGLSKLWKEVKKVLPQDYILVSYVDLRYFIGKSNEILGLKYSHTNPPSYHYTKDYKTLLNRMGYQKSLLKKKLFTYDPQLTEWSNMQLNGYDRIWDCGTVVYTNE